MRIAAGLFFWALAIALGIYVGIYLCLYWGIMDAITAFQADPVNTSAGVWAIIRAVFFEACGGLAMVVPAAIGTLLLDDV